MHRRASGYVVWVVRLLGALVVGAASSAGAAPTPSTVDVVVDPRVELAAVLCRLAGYPEFQARGIERYDEAVERHFRRFAEHEAVKATRELRTSQQIGFNATVGLALVADRSRSWAPRIPLDPLPPFVDGRWTSDSAQRWLALAGRFAEDSGFAEFLATVRPIHDEAVTSVRNELQQRLDLSWLRKFVAGDAAGDAPASFTVVLGLLHGQNSDGVHVQRVDGYTEFFAVLATPPMPTGTAIRYPIANSIALVVHEFAHSYVNPWVDRHAAQLETSAAALYGSVATQMRSASYGTPRILLYESLVRAVTHNYLRTHGLGQSSFTQWQAQDFAKGFYWVEPLTRLLREGPASESALDRNRERIVRFFEDWGRDAEARVATVRQTLADAAPVSPMVTTDRGPQIVRLRPAHDDVNVAPGLTELEIEFDRPMGDGSSVVYGPLPLPQVVASPAWDPSRRVFRLRVQLEPGTEYGVYLNNAQFQNFASEEGVPLKPRAWHFKTTSK